MLDLQQAKTTLRKFFERTPAAKLDALFRTLNTRSRTSVFRRLKAIGYISSFTHTGRYYTLREIPQFDSFGLWRWHDVGFSRAGTLKATVSALVESSPAGWTHRELQSILRVRAHNELLYLTQVKKIRREVLATRGAFYLSADKSLGARQLASRQAQEAGPGAWTTSAASAAVIEVLLDLLRTATVEATPAEVAQRLTGRGIPITVEQTHEVFDRYKLGGKRGARSPRSRR